jgi:hypothetical protein
VFKTLTKVFQGLNFLILLGLPVCLFLFVGTETVFEQEIFGVPIFLLLIVPLAHILFEGYSLFKKYEVKAFRIFCYYFFPLSWAMFALFCLYTVKHDPYGYGGLGLIIWFLFLYALESMCGIMSIIFHLKLSRVSSIK